MVNAPLFATFLLGMFWKRTTGHGAFTGLVTGTFGAVLIWCFTIAEGKGGVFGVVHTFPSVMAQNFWIAIVAFATCFLVTVLVTLFTRPRKESELEGLVYGLTKIRHDENAKWYERPVVLAVFVLVLAVILNIWFA